MKVKSLEDTIKKYIEKSLLSYIEGGKYTRDKRPKSINWIMGIIKKSGISKGKLEKIFDKLKSYPQDNEEKDRFHLVLKECEKQGFFIKY